MSLADKTLRKELEKYSKADIINALCATFNADHVVRSMLCILSRKAFDRAQKAEEKAFNEEMDSSDQYLKWLKEMAEKYGDGRRVNFTTLPAAELKKGGALIEQVAKTRKAAMDKMKAVDRACGITGRKKK